MTRRMSNIRSNLDLITNNTAEVHFMDTFLEDYKGALEAFINTE